MMDAGKEKIVWDNFKAIKVSLELTHKMLTKMAGKLESFENRVAALEDKNNKLLAAYEELGAKRAISKTEAEVLRWAIMEAAANKGMKDVSEHEEWELDIETCNKVIGRPQ